MSTLSSPNRVVWDYFFSLRQLVADAETAPSPELCRQSTALAIIMAVTVGEVFLNLWFRIHVESGSAVERSALLKDLSHPFASLDKKLKVWPKRHLHQELDLTSGPGGAFMALKSRRNSIVHFTSTHETFEHDNVRIHGLADTTEYDSLTGSHARQALEAAENLVAEVFRLAAIPSTMLPNAMHAWSGKNAV